MELNTDPSTGELAGIVGGVVTAIAAFLPWVTVNVDIGPASASGSAAGIEGLGIVTLLLAVAVLAVVLALDINQRDLVMAGCGVVIALVAVFKIVDLEGLAAAGIGLYLTLVAGVVITVGGGWVRTQEEETARGALS